MWRGRGIESWCGDVEALRGGVERWMEALRGGVERWVEALRGGALRCKRFWKVVW